MNHEIDAFRQSTSVVRENLVEAGDAGQRLIPREQARRVSRIKIPADRLYLSDHPALSPFQNVVGKEMYMARRLYGARIPSDVYFHIARQVDLLPFKPLKNFRRKARKRIAFRNQQEQKRLRPIHRYWDALKSKGAVRRDALNTFYDAYRIWLNVHPDLSINVSAKEICSS